MATFFRTRLAQVSEVLLLTGVLFFFFFRGIEFVEFHDDESIWIGTSYYAELFAHLDFSSPYWGESYWTLTAGPITRYLIGLGRRVGGYRWSDLNETWDYSSDDATNIARGNMPSPGLLWWSRAIMALLLIGSSLVLFWLVSQVAGRTSAYVLLLLFVTNPYFLNHLRRAMSESPLLFFTGWSIFAGVQVIRSLRQAAIGPQFKFRTLLSPFLWCALMGVFCGMAGAAKLNGLFTVFAGIGMIPLAAWKYGRGTLRQRWVGLASGLVAVILLATCFTFIFLYPYLYPDPIGRTIQLFKHRFSEMQIQQSLNPTNHLLDLPTRLSIIPHRVLQDYASLSFEGAWLVNAGLGVVGIGYLLYIAWRWLRNDDRTGTGVVILLVMFVTVVPALLTPLDWDRYYLFPIVFSTMGIAIGGGRCIVAASKWRRLKFATG